ncbi:MAG: antitoxin AF2212-like protein [Caldilineaceae bacterium]
MSKVREYHNEAIRLAQMAMAASQRNEHTESQQLARRAMEYETQAADLIPEGKSSEPTRSILYRSAASFAYQAGEYQEAERLIFKGLAGYPNVRVKQQLLEVQALIQEAQQNPDLAKEDRRALIQSVITATYENGVLHPSVALPLQEHQTVEIQILPDFASAPA